MNIPMPFVPHGGPCRRGVPPPWVPEPLQWPLPLLLEKFAEYRDRLIRDVTDAVDRRGLVSSVNGRAGAVTLTDADIVGLDALLAGKVSRDLLFDNPAGANPTVKSSLLPSYVDDVLEYAGLAAFPGTGEEGKIYVAKDTNRSYRWSGTQYVEVSPTPVPVAPSTDASAQGKPADAKATGDAMALRPTKAEIDAGWWSEWVVRNHGAVITNAKIEYYPDTETWMASVDSDYVSDINGSADATYIEFPVSGRYTLTATRHRVAAPVPTKPEDIGAASLLELYAAVRNLAPDFTAKEYALNDLCTYNGVFYHCKSAYTADAQSDKPDADTTHWEAKKVSEIFLPLTGGKTIDGDVKTIGYVYFGSDAYIFGDASGGTMFDINTPGDRKEALFSQIISTAIGASTAYAKPSDIGIPAFSSTATYALNAKVVHDNALWNCTTAVSTAGAWNAANWTKVCNLAADATPTANSANLMTSGAIKTALAAKLGPYPFAEPTFAQTGAWTFSGTSESSGHHWVVMYEVDIGWNLYDWPDGGDQPESTSDSVADPDPNATSLTFSTAGVTATRGYVATLTPFTNAQIEMGWKSDQGYELISGPTYSNGMWSVTFIPDASAGEETFVGDDYDAGENATHLSFSSGVATFTRPPSAFTVTVAASPVTDTMRDLWFVVKAGASAPTITWGSEFDRFGGGSANVAPTADATNVYHVYEYESGKFAVEKQGEYAPATNIQKSALASDVQTSLGKADTAVQPAALRYDLVQTITLGQLQDRAVQKVTLNAASTTLVLPALTDLTGKVADFGIDMVNAYEVSGTPTAASFQLDGTLGADYNLVVPDGETWSDMTALAAGEMAQFYFTLSSFQLDSKPTWKVVKQVVQKVTIPTVGE